MTDPTNIACLSVLSAAPGLDFHFVLMDIQDMERTLLQGLDTYQATPFRLLPWTGPEKFNKSNTTCPIPTTTFFHVHFFCLSFCCVFIYLLTDERMERMALSGMIFAVTKTNGESDLIYIYLICCGLGGFG